MSTYVMWVWFYFRISRLQQEGLVDVFEESIDNNGISEFTRVILTCFKLAFFKLFHLLDISWWSTIIALWHVLCLSKGQRLFMNYSAQCTTYSLMQNVKHLITMVQNICLTIKFQYSIHPSNSYVPPEVLSTRIPGHAVQYNITSVKVFIL